MVNQTTTTNTNTTTNITTNTTINDNNKIKKIRKARIQVQQRKNIHLQREEGGGDYNIWYHRFIGRDNKSSHNKDLSETRVNIKRDSGWTMACNTNTNNNNNNNNENNNSFFCLYFAKGCCSNGSNCKYLHRIPTMYDEKRIPITRDVFGREKHATDREDMGGTGSFNRECKTLYITGFMNNNNQYSYQHQHHDRHYTPPTTLTPNNKTNQQHDNRLKENNKKIEVQLIEDFKEFGQLEYVRAFSDRCYAFVKYKLRLCAEFAREAMQNQVLSSSSSSSTTTTTTDKQQKEPLQVLQIKWATDDMNPLAIKRNTLDLKSQLVQSIHDHQQQQVQQQQQQQMSMLAYPSSSSSSLMMVPQPLPPHMIQVQQQQQQPIMIAPPGMAPPVLFSSPSTTTVNNEQQETEETEGDTEHIDVKRLDYYHFLQATMKQSQRVLKQQVKSINSNQKTATATTDSVDSYPNTDSQYSNVNTTTTTTTPTNSTGDASFDQQFMKQLQGK